MNIFVGNLLGDALFHSNYTNLYKILADVFPNDNIYIVNGDKLVEDPLPEIKDVEEFLELPPFYSQDHFYYPKKESTFPCFRLGKVKSCMKKDKGRGHPQLQKETLEYLIHYFQPMLDKLEKGTGISLSI